ncbi:MAG: AgmX/PglI C-terminal domain-containing protein [Deltaproteobacteria bacterium]|nr:AgmX/PglI C-terminal domain-containing protein [Deltaproteobacteria bacterium]
MDSKHTRTPGSTKPGSMTMAMRAVGVANDKADVIRLGVVSGEGRLEERVLPLSSPIVIGSHAGASIVVPGLATPHVLVTAAGGVITLHVRATMKARLATLAGSRELEGRDEDVVLDAKSRGKVVIGGVTLLFQLASAPPKKQAPALPAAVRASWLSQLDMVFTALVACSFLGHFGFVVYLESADWPMTSSIDRVPDHVAEMIFVDEQPPDPPDETPDPTTDDTTTPADTTTPDDTTVAENETPRPRPDRPNPSPSPSPMTDEQVRIAMEAATTGAIQMIGSPGESDAMRDLLAGGAMPLDQATLMAGVTGFDIATNTPTIRDRTGGGPIAGDFSIQHLGTRPVGPVNEGEPVREVGPTIAFTGPQDDDLEIDGVGEFDQALVVRMIQRRRAQITACYEHAILSDPTLRGRVEIQMTIEENGSVSGVRTIENGMGTDVVSRCIESRVRGFRFTPGPTGGSVQFRFPFVFEQQR